MIYPEVLRSRKNLDHLFKLTSDLNRDSACRQEAVARLSEYLCIRVSGFVEVAVRDVLLDYAGKHSSNHVLDYVDSELAQWRNLNESRICNLVRCFSDEWATDLEARLVDPMKSSLDAIVDIRNNLAHGQQFGVSLVTAKGHYSNILKALQQIASVCNPQVKHWFV